MHIVRVFRCSSQGFATHLREPLDTQVCRDTAVENHWYMVLKGTAQNTHNCKPPDKMCYTEDPIFISEQIILLHIYNYLLCNIYFLLCNVYCLTATPELELK